MEDKERKDKIKKVEDGNFLEFIILRGIIKKKERKRVKKNSHFQESKERKFGCLGKFYFERALKR